MSEIKQQRLESEYGADDVWRLINTPLIGELGRRVNPYVEIECRDLNSDGLIAQGSLVVYRPNLAKLKPSLGMAADMLPNDVAMRVDEHDSGQRIRVDVLESDKHEGRLRYAVEEADGGSILIMEGEVILGGSMKMFSAMVTPYAERGLREHNQRAIDSLSVILG